VSEPSRVSPTPSLIVLPILTGYTGDFAGLVERTRDFIRYRESSLGPWLYDESAQSGSVWHWNARQGLGDSCQDGRILDEFVEIVFAHDPLSGTVGITSWRPSPRGILTRDGVILNQALSFISAHLVQPEQFAFVRSPQMAGVAPVAEFMRNGAVECGAGASNSVDSLAEISLINAVFFGAGADDDSMSDSGDDESEGGLGGDVIEIDLPSLGSEHFVADWLDVLLADYTADNVDAVVDVPQDVDALHARLDDLYVQLFEPDEYCASAFKLTFEALFARVAQRTNEMRSLYGHLESAWPGVPSPRITYPTAHLTFCVTTPELARAAAQIQCDFCEGCDGRGDLHIADQLRMAV